MKKKNSVKSKQVVHDSAKITSFFTKAANCQENLLKRNSHSLKREEYTKIILKCNKEPKNVKVSVHGISKSTSSILGKHKLVENDYDDFKNPKSSSKKSLSMFNYFHKRCTKFTPIKNVEISQNVPTTDEVLNSTKLDTVVDVTTTEDKSESITQIKNTSECIAEAVDDIQIEKQSTDLLESVNEISEPVSDNELWLNELDVSFHEDDQMKTENVLDKWISMVKNCKDTDDEECYKIAEIYQCPKLRKIVLLLNSKKNGIKKMCSLEGFWTNTSCKVGDEVRILADFINGQATVNNDTGLLIVHPDDLISSTTVVSTLFCLRKAILADKFVGWDPGNNSMLLGTLIHQLFQETVQEDDDDTSIEDLNRKFKSLLMQPRNLHSLYSKNMNEKEIETEASDYFPHILKWKQEHMRKDPHFLEESTHQENKLHVSSIVDIEETIWCPKYGLRGKIDLNTEVKIHGRKKQVPLELKTGQATFSPTHQGQVALYTMLMERCDKNCDEGLLLYLKGGPQMKLVTSHHTLRRDVIQLRNEFAHYSKMASTVEKVDCTLSSLPPPMNNKRLCQKCPFLLPCALNQRIFETNLPMDCSHAMHLLVPETTNHLSSLHLEYFKQWHQFLHLEKQKFNSGSTPFWKETSIEREQVGLCFSEMVLCQRTYYPDIWWDDKCYIHTFKKYSMKKDLQTVGLQLSDRVVVSSNTNNKELALTTGEIVKITSEKVDVSLDRNLYQRSHWPSEVYRLDKIESYSVLSIHYTNLLHLMDKNKKAVWLRKLIIDRALPLFKEIQSLVGTDHEALKSLNKQQLKSINKILSCSDYVLLKGMPGTGKTSTLVALVRVLVEMKQSVLLTSYTNSALDNILVRLKKHNIDFIRLGNLSRMHPYVRSHAAEVLTKKIKNVKELDTFYKSKQVVGITCLGINHPLFQHRTFDICIVDEASQILQTACIGPLFYAKKFILVGDPQQLPPVVNSKKARSLGMSESLFARLERENNTMELNVQYRMNGEIMRLCNVLTYKGKLKCGSTEVEHATFSVPMMNSVPGSLSWHKSVLSADLNKAVLFLDTDFIPAAETCDSQGLVQNKMEADIVTQLSWAMMKAGVTENDIGIISPYKRQVHLLQDFFRSHQMLGIEINTIDRYQGRDKSVIVISCVRSLVGGKIAELLQDERRLNVAISRAKHKLLFVGSKSTLIKYIPFHRIITNLREDQIVKVPKAVVCRFWNDIEDLA